MSGKGYTGEIYAKAVAEHGNIRAVARALGGSVLIRGPSIETEFP